MNSQWLSFASVLIFTLVVRTNASIKTVTLGRTAFKTPLPFLYNFESKTSQLAIPHENKQDRSLVDYHINDSEEEFLIACPAPYGGPGPIPREYWRSTPETFDESATLFERTFIIGYTQCSWELVPSIETVQREIDGNGYCSQSQARMYGVGYKVVKRRETYKDISQDIRHESLYEICYSKAEGKTLYSIHRIQAPSLLLLDHTEELPELEPLKAPYESFLDASSRTKTYFEDKKHYAYQYVGVDDMPARPWKLTTNFLFNHTPITRNDEVFKGMIRADVYIRLYSKKNNKPLTLYSGTYQKCVEGNITCGSLFGKPPTETLVDSFWRIIKDDDDRAIILVTQHTLKKCDQEYLCEKNRRVKKYKKGGCIYTCSLNTNDRLFRTLDLPTLEITGDLDFTLETKMTEIGSSKEIKSLPEKSTKNSIDIFSFLSTLSFVDAVANIDSDIAHNMFVQQDD